MNREWRPIGDRMGHRPKANSVPLREEVGDGMSRVTGVRSGAHTAPDFPQIWVVGQFEF